MTNHLKIKEIFKKLKELTVKADLHLSFTAESYQRLK